MNRSVGLYIGCGIDFKIMSLLKNHIETCIYIDSQPLTCYGDQHYNSDTCKQDISVKYMTEFKNGAEQAGFIKISIDTVYPHIYRNYNTSQEIYHYFGLPFPIISIKSNYIANIDELNRLRHLLNSVTYLIVIGYSPNSNIFKYISKHICFVGNHTTIYKDNLTDLLPYEKDKITNILQTNTYDVQSRIKMYIYFDKNDNYFMFNSYNDFINKTIET
jgi:hypothetical protein